MPFIAPYEQLALEKEYDRGIEKGKEKGIQIGIVLEAQTVLLEFLNDQFGEIPAKIIKSIQMIEDLSRLRSIRKQIHKAKSLDEVKQFLEESKSQTENESIK